MKHKRHHKKHKRHHHSSGNPLKQAERAVMTIARKVKSAVKKIAK